MAKNDLKIVDGWKMSAEERRFSKYVEAVRGTTDQATYQKKQGDEALSCVENFRTAIDVGACVGFWTRDLCTRFERVECSEPTALSAEFLYSCAYEMVVRGGKEMIFRKSA